MSCFKRRWVTGSAAHRCLNCLSPPKPQVLQKLEGGSFGSACRQVTTKRDNQLLLRAAVAADKAHTMCHTHPKQPVHLMQMAVSYSPANISHHFYADTIAATITIFSASTHG